ncbi:MAG: hypothetical protein C0617_04705 [Desulfuromonas sp.]|uniref:hypothetical protein n=1 Tax=Desulfuromonas sp. TaxID=892 RepID=UPI000CBD7387|nr:hypothetical protein [Desulfuromonas sp.]PLX85374.1 MAG: hypothetical protein C0617_04705 [Desulfuromonas sp.]
MKRSAADLSGQSGQSAAVAEAPPKRVRLAYHLLRDVLPTLLILGTLGWLALLAAGQIDLARSAPAPQGSSASR